MKRYRHAQLLFALALLLFSEPFVESVTGAVFFDVFLAITVVSVVLAEGLSRRLDAEANIWVLARPLIEDWARDNLGTWRYPIAPGGEHQRELAIRLGVNVVMYALCLDYKDDQVHAPFIMRRRGGSP